MNFCDHCGSPVQNEARFCRRCGVQLSSPSVIEESERILQKVSAIPFENRDQLGFWKSLWATWKLACLNPSLFFPGVGDTNDTNSALIFFVVVATLGTFASYLISLPFRLAYFVHFMSVFQQGNSAFPQVTSTLLILGNVLGLLFAPVFLFIGFLFSALITHLFLLIVRGAPRGLGTTLRAMAYAGGANLIPGIGWIWAGFLMLIGLAKAHHTEGWRPVLAMVIELFVCLLFLAIPIIFLFNVIRNFHN